ncbi:hypothetical protein GRAN_4693 [Granulicella sibirica]|uniref:Uncharacterized protein n=1 Tax=Granulicella sibirica TaxID=2479048 RepID=A0A4Q0SUJ7_9BACT|nr:hypothetical protein GRAN_4693 [Granulicella sibirica]
MRYRPDKVRRSHPASRTPHVPKLPCKSLALHPESLATPVAQQPPLLLDRPDALQAHRATHQKQQGTAAHAAVPRKHSRHDILHKLRWTSQHTRNRAPRHRPSWHPARRNLCQPYERLNLRALAEDHSSLAGAPFAVCEAPMPAV